MKRIIIIAGTFLLSAMGIAGVCIFLIGLEWIEITPIGLKAADKAYFILIGGSVVLLVSSAGILFRRELAIIKQKSSNLCA